MVRPHTRFVVKRHTRFEKTNTPVFTTTHTHTRFEKTDTPVFTTTDTPVFKITLTPDFKTRTHLARFFFFTTGEGVLSHEEVARRPQAKSPQRLKQTIPRTHAKMPKTHAKTQTNLMQKRKRSPHRNANEARAKMQTKPTQKRERSPRKNAN